MIHPGVRIASARTRAADTKTQQTEVENEQRSKWRSAPDALELIEQMKQKVRSEERNRNPTGTLFIVTVIAIIIAVVWSGYAREARIALALSAVGGLATVLFIVFTPNYTGEKNRIFLSDEELAVIATLPAEMREPMKVHLDANGCITVSEVLSAVEAYPQHVADRVRRSLPGFRAMMGAK